MTERVPAPDTNRANGLRSSANSESLWRPALVRGLGLVVGIVTLTFVGMLGADNGPPKPTAPLEAALVGGEWLAAPAADTGQKVETAASEPTAEPSGPTPSQTTRPRSDASASAPPDKPPPEPPSGITTDGKVVLNLANVDELTRLPGVGKKRAERILALRTRLKRFRKPSDLLRVRGIGAKTLRKMLPHLVLDAPARTTTVPKEAPTAPEP